MTEQSTRLSLPLIQPSQAQKHVTHNSALEILDAVAQLNVLSREANTPPTLTEEGTVFALGAAPQAVWAGHPNEVAIWSNGGWLFVEPREGWVLYDQADDVICVRKGAVWEPVTPNLDNIAGVGINASADAVNRLIVSADATLLTHETTGGHQLKVNKAATSDVASLLFQSGYSGRAEMGTMGNDDFAIKVSADGATFVTALAFDGVTGRATGEAVQQSSDDVTPGRLMRADWGYSSGNVVGTVAQTAGSPTGAVIESATTPQGAYVRFADGTQICSGPLNLNFGGANRIEAVWVFPVPFVGVPVVTGSVDANSIQADATPDPDALGALMSANTDGTQATFAQYRIAGLTDFQSGDTAMCQVMAIGRWF
ncbi:DUF2793 domain-containing protein [uncultured Tateyamaria sp.]|uniref:DUF2793 domain-containing protein n=1 Tax=uncultured Tateyamaria sp. TaxID=455651 RepID=UPI00260A2DF2|nr:DUF2793 domain-containing protein [uncultured Tateyamaria sp.]